MSWFKRVKDNILTKTEDKNNTPDGLWKKCPACKKALQTKALRKNSYVCLHCDHHLRIGSEEYFELLFDDGQYSEFGMEVVSSDPLEFTDTKKYPDRVKAMQAKTGLRDALRTAYGMCHGKPLVVAAMDFRFIGGSMGSVVGEKIARAIDYGLENHVPVLVISKSGGARMMEGALSLMQMAKISAKLALLSQKKIPYVSLLTDPTTGGVTASFAMLGDLNIAEPDALIGFAGPRVIKETIGRDLPEGFQRSEFVLEHGFLDYIVHRGELKDRLAQSLRLLMKNPPLEKEEETTQE
ncbi:acetyl-CoA carboxylase, carboxyltransferase subunit beta [Pontibacter sp. G13]|uniref:acetyl-CoA carboxylase, carboxyltransferase subunit beta n=1 Tax=Pontibacter sp. G13 TaxID=3074898 RepID=UPI00288B3E60|nr:acetyl-CoA carboxylase, carboxyltransferase subunit beta [Pontibacter sp. G13]WNJ16843.1 acetyl-CoA carboxylase, carboxyltransferase subunit beta [Pontibacter sp. G13]